MCKQMEEIEIKFIWLTLNGSQKRFLNTFVHFPPLRMHTTVFLSEILKYCSLILDFICDTFAKTDLRVAQSEVSFYCMVLKMLRNYIFFFKVTCLRHSNLWTQFHFQTTSDYLSVSFPKNLVSYFSKSLLTTYYGCQALYWILGL